MTRTLWTVIAVAGVALGGCVVDGEGTTDGGVTGGQGGESSGGASGGASSGGGQAGGDSGGESGGGQTEPDGGVAGPPSCEDGLRNGDELFIDCGGPVCRSCEVELTESEPNDGGDQATAVPVGSGIIARISGRIDHDDDFLSFEVTEDKPVYYQLEGRIEGEGASGFIYVFTHDGNTLPVGLGFGGGAFSFEPKLLTEESAPGHYTLQIGSDSAAVSYVLTVWTPTERATGDVCYTDDPGVTCGGGFPCEVAEGETTGRCDGPVCGDQMVEGTESCDDGGRVAGDGCDPDCHFEAVVPTARREDAVVLTFADNPGEGLSARSEFPIGAPFDQWYAFDLAAPTDLIVFVENLDTNTCGSTVQIELFQGESPAPTAIDRDSLESECPQIAPGFWPGAMDVPAGRHYVRLRAEAGIPRGRGLLTVGQVARLADGSPCMDGGVARCQDRCVVPPDSQWGTCRSDDCGDGIVQPGEACDAGRPDFPSLCEDACHTAVASGARTPIETTLDGGNTLDVTLAVMVPTRGQLSLDGVFNCAALTVSLVNADVPGDPGTRLDPQPDGCTVYGPFELARGNYRIRLALAPGSAQVPFTLHWRTDEDGSQGDFCQRVAGEPPADGATTTCLAPWVCRPTGRPGLGVCELPPVFWFVGAHDTTESALELAIDHRVSGPVAAGTVLLVQDVLESSMALQLEGACPLNGALTLMRLDANVLGAQGLEAALATPLWQVERAPGDACDTLPVGDGPGAFIDAQHLWFAVRPAADETVDLGLLRERWDGERCEVDGRYSLCAGECVPAEPGSLDGLCVGP